MKKTKFTESQIVQRWKFRRPRSFHSVLSWPSTQLNINGRSGHTHPEFGGHTARNFHMFSCVHCLRVLPAHI